MIRKLIAGLMIFSFVNFTFAQTNTTVSINSPPSTVSSWTLFPPDANSFLLKKNNPFWSGLDLYILTPLFMGKLLQEIDLFKINEISYTNQISQYKLRLTDRDKAYDNLNLLYNKTLTRVENYTNQISYMTAFVDYQDTQLKRAFSREKLGVFGDILVFGAGILIGGLVTFAMFYLVNAASK